MGHVADELLVASASLRGAQGRPVALERALQLAEVSQVLFRGQAEGRGADEHVRS